MGVYPRACGATTASGTGSASSSDDGLSPRLQVAEPLLRNVTPAIVNGLSPRLRGNPPLPHGPTRPIRSIPAPAGEPWSVTSRPSSSGVYPRACGGTESWTDRGKGQFWGLSPCACGGTLTFEWAATGGVGLSPRLRGNLANGRRRRGDHGSIPAPAGEPRKDKLGGAVEAGLSPRLRGNLAQEGQSGRGLRSIPAPAGEPVSQPLTGGNATVYPRACGGTPRGGGSGSWKTGLSPRLRGNRAHVSRSYPFSGSIPAPAGEPIAAFAFCAVVTVYPRACGGTSPTVSISPACCGLSPRLRGNQCSRCLAAGRGRSIPAPAGEPIAAGGLLIVIRVYPRACGGTFIKQEAKEGSPGLSPRLRGNRVLTSPFEFGLRSIPAPAGEPHFIQ